MREFTPVAATAGGTREQLTLAGLEVESVTPVAPPFSGVLVGKVLETAAIRMRTSCRCAR